MAFDSEKKVAIADVIKVERSGHKLVLPENVPYNRIIKALQAQEAYEESDVAIDGTVDGFIWEGAYAFYRVLVDEFGFATSVPIPSFFGDNPPSLRTIPVGLDEYVQIPWGRFVLPGVEGFLQTGATQKDGRFVFQIQGVVKRRYEDAVQQLVQLTQKRVKENPIYGGKAFRVRLRDEDGDVLPLPEPKFIPINPEIMNELVFSEEVQAAIEISLFTPIQHSDLVRDVKGSLKRGILLSGEYGVGKSMTSAAAAHIATENGWTFIVCERADELADVLRLASSYPRSVVFCEDIDQVVTGERSINMNDLLNVVDGVDSKNMELIVVFTTNHPEKINRAMLRPGRLDAVINVLAPDTEAVSRLIQQYARGLLAEDVDVLAVAETMKGNIPAVIREMVERAKLAAIRRAPHSNKHTLTVTQDDLVAASHSMRNQLELLRERPEDVRSVEEKSAEILAKPIADLATVLSVQNPDNLSNGHATAG